jgi:hypothetical protein
MVLENAFMKMVKKIRRETTGRQSIPKKKIQELPLHGRWQVLVTIVLQIK